MLNTGIVSNCWNFYLHNGVPLKDLVAHAADLQMRDVEFRQGSLGDLEPTHNTPHLDSFKAIAQAHYNCRFDYAMSFPFFGESFDSSTCSLQLGRDVALACGNGDAHLRLVDVTSDNTTAADHFERTVCSLAELADDLYEYGIRLSVEHSFQSWDLFWPLFDQAKSRSSSSNLWICFDPANLSLAGEADRIDQVVRNIEKTVISMLHVKQANRGTIETELCEGEVLWPDVVQQFHAAAYSGPMMFEFISSPEIERVTLESLRLWRTWLLEAMEN